MDVCGFVLAGGRSSRMGTDKALLELDGEPLVARAWRSLQRVSAEVAIVGGAEELRRFGRQIPDSARDCGPLGGIVSALEQTAFAWNLFLAVDVPFVPESALEHLLAAAGESEAVAVLPEVRGVEQPLCGVYARRAASTLRMELDCGRYKVTAALREAGPVHLLRFDEPGWFRNLNTPEDYREALASVAAKPEARAGGRASKG